MVLDQLKMIKLRVIFRAEEKGQLPPYLGSTIRGILGHSMRQLVCIAPSTPCHQCPYATDCDYATFFNPPGSFAGSVKPYVIYVPLRNKTEWQRGDLLPFEITFFGHAIQAADYYLAGILGMEDFGWGAQRLKFSLQQITNTYDNTLIWSGGDVFFHHLNPFTLSDLNKIVYNPRGVFLRFNSPTRILIRRTLVKKIHFEHIIRAILIRLNLLLHAFVGVQVKWNEEAILEEAKCIEVIEENWKFVNFKRYSFSYDRKLRLPSVIGYARFTGNLEPFTTFLEMGKFVHIGKNATHGFGNYHLYYYL